MQTLLRVVALKFALVALMTVSACGDYKISLPNGYSLVRIYAGAILIAAPTGEPVVNANVDKYTVIDDLVIGHVTIAELLPEREASRPGYFILNTITHELAEGLDRQSWEQELKENSISTVPILEAPSRFDRDY